ncbi:hydrogenase expression protein [Azospirillum sp. TSH7]|uniref:HyaD/HybD family hydrogenase maturation endopeptidase n=1 Tax=unclassified Azospirillum TaxID=2630922 RepID=UPI000D622BCF|nr:MULTISPECIES: HyaD/HybD family hydrogenase maturation endopeptidase [unclassified Azospirillum]PWC56685.1 hydrogenase expression protein [Azospirillum sp. TSH7]PWC58789.1 hydrogenase expression protein [Azospirillum sp. TSH20]
MDLAGDESGRGTAQILVLGIGNILWADEGFGVRTVERLAADWRFPDNVTLMDGGTQGLYLLPHLEAADALIVVDAIDYGLPPGTRRVFHGDDVPAFLGAKKMSLHQTGFQEVLASAMFLGRCPQKLILVGVQPECLEDYGGGLTDTVAAQVTPTIDVILNLLCDEFGVEGTPVEAAADIAAPAIARDAYEGGRPSAEDACRIGDPRILAALSASET